MPWIMIARIFSYILEISRIYVFHDTYTLRVHIISICIYMYVYVHYITEKDGSFITLHRIRDDIVLSFKISTKTLSN